MKEQYKGFKISYDAARNILKFQAWGLWDTDTAQKFEHEWTAKIKEVSARGQDWHALIDLTDFPPQTQEIQEFTRRMIDFEKEHGVKKEAHLVSQILTKWQIKRIAQEAHLAENSFFQDEAEAIQWLLKRES